MGFISGIKKIPIKKHITYDNARKVGLQTKSIAENSGPRNPKISTIRDSKFSSRLSKNVYVKPRNFIDFEAGLNKTVHRTFSKPKGFIDFGANI